MKIKYLTTDEIIKIHDRIIEESGGHKGMISKGNLEFIVSQMEVTKDLIRKAAVLFNGVLTNHPFVDGNKRTGLESMKTFFYLNNKKFVASENDIWIKVHEISERKLKFEEVVNWIKKNVSDRHG